MTDRFFKNVSLGRMLFGYMIFVVCMIALEPFRFRMPYRAHILLWGPLSDFVKNILLFLPIGFLFKLSGFDEKKHGFAPALVMGIGLSGFLEGSQIFIAGRYATLVDVMANGTGCVLGAFLHDLIRGKIRKEGALKELLFNLPLTGLVYLLVPMICLHLLASMGDGPKLCLMIFPMVAILLIGASIIKNRRMPLKKERRFEIPTVKKTVPVYLLYLLLLFVWPGGFDFSEFTFTPGLNPLPEGSGPVNEFRMAQLVAGFTLLGYMMGELRSRTPASPVRHGLVILGACLVAATSFQIFRGFHTLYSFSALELFLIAGAGLFGGLVFMKLQKELGFCG